MQPKRVFKTKTFDRWAKKTVSDELLCIAAREIEAGQFEADLGHGKSGAVRTLVAKRHSSAVIFLAGREKNQPGQDFSDTAMAVAKSLAEVFQKQNLAQLLKLKELGELKEIRDDQKRR